MSCYFWMEVFLLGLVLGCFILLTFFKTYFPMQLRLASKSSTSSHFLLSAGFIGLYYHTYLKDKL